MTSSNSTPDSEAAAQSKSTTLAVVIDNRAGTAISTRAITTSLTLKASSKMRAMIKVIKISHKVSQGSRHTDNSSRTADSVSR